MQVALDEVVDSSNTNTAPYSVSIERTSISIVALTWLNRCLVKIYNDSKTSHEEQEEYYPELTYASLASPSLPE